MTPKPLSLIIALILSLFVFGCGSKDADDTSALPPADQQQRLDTATKGIESSPQMTDEQKQQALQYAQQSAQEAQKMKESARAAGAPVGD